MLHGSAEEENAGKERGQGNIEYILIIAVVVCALLFLYTQFGETIRGMFTSKSDLIASADNPLDHPSASTAVRPDSDVAEAATEEDAGESGTVTDKKHKSGPEPVVTPQEPSFISRILPWVLLILVAILMIAILVIKIKQRHILRNLQQEEEGQAMTETALSLPIVLLFVFAIMQLGLCYHARFLVHLASFYAARSAIVWIPDESGEGKNMIKIDSSDPKFSKMLNSARLPCIPISSQVSVLLRGIEYTGIPDTGIDVFDEFADSLAGTLLDSTGILDALNSLLNSLSIDAGNNFVFRVLQKYAYAYLCTSVELMEEGTMTPVASGATATFSENGPITVRVNYYYHLQLPLINAVLGQRVFPSNMGAIGSGDIFESNNLIPFSLRGWFLKIRCTTTLDNEGFVGLD